MNCSFADKLTEQGLGLFNSITDGQIKNFQKYSVEGDERSRQILFVNSLYNEWIAFWNSFETGDNSKQDYNQLYFNAASEFLKEKNYFVDNDFILNRVNINDTLIFNIERYIYSR